VDTPPAVFLKRHERFQQAQKHRERVPYRVLRDGQWAIESFVPPPPLKARLLSAQRDAGGPRKATPEKLQAVMREPHGAGEGLGRRLGVTTPWVYGTLRRLGRAPTGQKISRRRPSGGSVQ
jgi:hypothetical protein